MNKKRQDIEYLSLDDLTAFERRVFDLAIAALSMPITPRQAWFTRCAEEMIEANARAGDES